MFNGEYTYYKYYSPAGDAVSRHYALSFAKIPPDKRILSKSEFSEGAEGAT
jgi:hypothetical protein